MKILCVEDGSVDIESFDIESFETDLKNGKVLLYRQGAKPPYVLDIDAPDFVYKEMWEKLKSNYSNVWNYSVHSFSAENIIDEMREYEKNYLGDR